MYIPEKRKNRQITLFDFNQSCGMQLDPENEWIRLAHAIPWNRMEVRYAAFFPSRTGHPATPLQMALGILIIQKRRNLSDRAVIKEIQENPYLQYFIGMERFSHEPPVKATALVGFRKRLSADFLMEANEYILEVAGTTEEHKEKKKAGMQRLPTRRLRRSKILEPRSWMPHAPHPTSGIPRTSHS